MKEEHKYTDPETGEVIVYEEEPFRYLEKKFNYRVPLSVRLRVALNRFMRRVVGLS